MSQVERNCGSFLVLRVVVVFGQLFDVHGFEQRLQYQHVGFTHFSLLIVFVNDI